METNGILNGKKNLRPVVTAIIQARMQSKRLPRKTMLELGGKPILAHVIERTRQIENVNRVIVATGDDSENNEIIDLATLMGVDSFVGSMDNVLERFYQAVEKYGGDLIIRVTADNPFIDIEYASMVVDIAIESGSDYCALSGLPLGTAVEVMKRETLVEAYENATAAYQKEHVTPFIKEHPELFSIERPKANIKAKYRKIRLTIDTEEDYKLAKILYDNLYKDGPFPLSAIFDYVDKDPDVITINSGVKQRFASHSEDSSK